eukprot:TRINITY_DN5891_c0_g1_i1.p1 TRINITY_DN5891_c0_g1~~TRINITY_DN5891_c0_g1_i1.p1  ORF type:complete len:207 (-),score=28.73 TRINITY_DN5891_c0_g1_i1:50-670(-)
MTQKQQLKLVIVGEGSVGKTSLLISYALGMFPAEYTPTVFDQSNTTLQVKDQTFELSLWDTAGREEYDRLRPLSYPGTDVILLAYSIGLPSSLERIKSYYSEVNHHLPRVPIVLVGLKSDLREQEQTNKDLVFTSHEQGLEMAKHIGAVQYVECSSLKMKGVKKVFEVAAMAPHLKSPETKQKKRTIWSSLWAKTLGGIFRSRSVS